MRGQKECSNERWRTARKPLVYTVDGITSAPVSLDKTTNLGERKPRLDQASLGVVRGTAHDTKLAGTSDPMMETRERVYGQSVTVLPSQQTRLPQQARKLLSMVAEPDDAVTGRLIASCGRLSCFGLPSLMTWWRTSQRPLWSKPAFALDQ